MCNSKKNILFSKSLSLLIFTIILSCNESEKIKDKESEIKVTVEVQEPISELETRFIEQGLVDVQTIDSTIMVELKYSTTDNFFGKDVYGNLEKAFLQEDVALKLKEAQLSLKKINPNFSLLVYDGVRPYSVQKILWNSLDTIPPKTREAYVANPAEGSIHNYGCAVDLTVFDMRADSTLDMGTKYDYFGDLAYPRKENEMLAKGELTEKQIENRKILRNVMKGAGFMPITSEWWHFNFVSRKQAEKKYLIIQ